MKAIILSIVLVAAADHGPDKEGKPIRPAAEPSHPLPTALSGSVMTYEKLMKTAKKPLTLVVLVPEVDSARKDSVQLLKNVSDPANQFLAENANVFYAPAVPRPKLGPNDTPPWLRDDPGARTSGEYWHGAVTAMRRLSTKSPHLAPQFEPLPDGKVETVDLPGVLVFYGDKPAGYLSSEAVSMAKDRRQRAKETNESLFNLAPRMRNWTPEFYDARVASQRPQPSEKEVYLRINEDEKPDRPKTDLK